MWISRDPDGCLWIHPYSRPVLHEYTDYKGNNQKRWVTESQFEVDRSLYQSLTFENSPKELKLGDVYLEKS